MLFDRSVGVVAQLDVIEVYGIILFRTADHHHGRVFVFRLSELEEFQDEDGPAIGNDLNVPTWQPRSRTDLKDDAIEASKGCSVYATTRKECGGSKGLKLAFAVGRKVTVMKWRHQEEWYNLTSDTAEGFEVVAEFAVSDAAVTLTLIDDFEEELRVLVGTKHGFELYHDSTVIKLLSLPSGSDGAVSAIEVS